MVTQELMEYKRHSFEVYCKTLLRNKARTLHKKQSLKEHREVVFSDIQDEVEDLLFYEDVYNLDEQEFFVDRERRYPLKNRALISSLSLLLPKYREVIILSYFMEHNDSEISRMLGIPVSTVNNRRMSAIKRLREKMRSEDES